MLTATSRRRRYESSLWRHWSPSRRRVRPEISVDALFLLLRCVRGAKAGSWRKRRA